MAGVLPTWGRILGKDARFVIHSGIGVGTSVHLSGQPRHYGFLKGSVRN